MSELFIPSVLENINGEMQVMNLLNWSFAKERTIYITGEVTDIMVLSVVSQIEYLSKKSTNPIKIYINSPGGSVTAGLAIYDAMNNSKCDIITIGTGLVASMGSFLLSSGSKGMRYVTNSTEVMIHQPSVTSQGRVSDMLINIERFVKVKDRLNHILAQNTGKTVEQIKADCDKDYWLYASEAVEYGIADGIYQNE